MGKKGRKESKSHPRNQDGESSKGHGPHGALDQHSCENERHPHHSHEPWGHSHDGVPCHGHGYPLDHQGSPNGFLSQDEEEQEAFGRIVHAYRNYFRDANWEVTRWERNYNRLPDRHQALLASMPIKCQRAREAIMYNQVFLNHIVQAYDAILCRGPTLHVNFSDDPPDTLVEPNDVEKVRYVLKNLVRDWAEEGAAERAQSYGRIIRELKPYVDAWPGDQGPPRVLVPGCGLGRLCLEAASLGCLTEGNEFSFYMLLASNLMLNGTEEARQWHIFPWLLSPCNQLSDADQLRSVTVPDVWPGDMLPAPHLLSMSAGDMVEVYSHPQRTAAYDFVLTCFFIDTSHNIIEYIEVIHNALKEGGIWINLGPLLYHWADSHTYLPDEELSIELSLEEVVRIACLTGFRLLRKEMVPTGFNVNMRSMMTSSYRSVFWTMAKDSTAGTAPPAADAEVLPEAVPEAPLGEVPAPSASDSGTDFSIDNLGPAVPGGLPVSPQHPH